MTSLMALWLPILLAAVLAFIASSIIHMMLPWHKRDFAAMPREEDFRAAVRPLDIPPGDYMVPRPVSMEEMKSEAFRAKLREGPRVILTVLPTGEVGMGRALGLWFLFLLVIALFAGYVASRVLGPTAEYLDIMQVVATTAFLGLAGALWHMSIWYHRAWRITLTATVDALVYALLMGGVFGWLWPR